MASIDNLFETADPMTSGIYERECKVNTAELVRLLPTGEQTGSAPVVLRFNLFDDVNVTLHTRHIQPGAQGGFSWSGQLSGVMDIYGHLSVSRLDAAHPQNCVVAGSVTTGAITYGILPAGPGRVRIIRVKSPTADHDDVAYGLTQDDADNEDVGLSDTALEAAIVDNPEDSPDEYPQLAIIDILVIYAKDVLSEIAGGLAAIHAHMELAALKANDTFQFSKIPARVRIVGVEEAALKNGKSVSLLLYEVIGRPEKPEIGQPAVEPDAASAAAVNALREQYQADIIALVVPETIKDRVRGIAGSIPEPPDAEQSELRQSTFAVCLDAISDNTFTHELGHLLGAKHDRNTQPYRLGLPMYDYVRGYTVDKGNSLVTVMGYSGADGVRVPAFSSADADITWNGQPLGVPISEYNSADAAAFLRRSVFTVAAYRGSHDEQIRYQLDLAVDPPEAGTAIPYQAGPYLKDSIVTVMAFQRAGGYRFSHWKLGRHFHSITPATTVVMNQPNTLTAVFDDSDAHCNLFTSVEPPDAATIIVTPPGSQFDASTQVALTLQSAPGSTYGFIGWYKDDEASGSLKMPFNIRLDRDTQVQAKFAKGLYKIEVKIVPAGAGLVTTSNGVDQQHIFAGEAFWLTRIGGYLLVASARDDWWFAWWQANGDEAPYQEAVTVPGPVSAVSQHSSVWLVTEDQLIEAHFQGGPGALRLTGAHAKPADAATVLIALADNPKIQSSVADAAVSPENYYFIPGTLLQASFVQTEEQKKYHFQGWSIDASPLVKANIGDTDYQWQINKECAIVAVFA